MKALSQLHKILIAVDDSSYSEIAANYGFELARKMNAEIGLLHVSEVPVRTSFGIDPMLNDSSLIMPEMMQIQEEASKKLLSRYADTYGKDTTVHSFRKVGNPTDEIIATANEWDAGMIILGTHGRTGLDHFISGSVAESVVRKANCPVLIIPNKAKQSD